MAQCVRRRQDDHRAARSADPPLRDRRDRQRQLALQEPRRRSPDNPRSRRLRIPDQLRRRERYRPNPSFKRVKIGRRSGVKFGSRLTPKELLNWFSMQREGHLVGQSSPTTDGDVTADYVGSLSNAVTIIARLHRGERRLVFAESRARVEEIAAGLRSAGVRTFVSHASLSLDERRQAESAFAEEPDCVMVATSTLELGLDVGDLDRVIQIGAPRGVASFLQRMGRTGRRSGAKRNCLFLATDDEELLVSLALTTLWREGKVDPVVPPANPAHLFAQQIMALTLQLHGIPRPDIVGWLGDVVHAVPAADRAAIVAHMLESEILAEDAGILGLGVKGEEEFGRRHFSDLVAAFSEPLLLLVRHGLTDLGTVHP